jgi:hypothetical protein
VRVDLRVAELGRDQLLELLREDVFEHLGLVVDSIPRHAQRLREVELEQPVVAQHLQRERLAVAAQLDALVGDVAHQPAIGELLDHARHGGRGDAHTRGERRGGHGLALAAALKGVDRLDVVLHRLGVVDARSHQIATRRDVA